MFIKVYFKCNNQTTDGSLCSDCDGSGYIEQMIPVYMDAGNGLAVDVIKVEQMGNKNRCEK